MFLKRARVQSLGEATVVSGTVRLASKVAESQPHSFYADGARVIPAFDILASAADIYAISPDPADYVFEAIRANTTNVPNENSDGFHQSELLRFDTRLAMPVYGTYVGKPHHVDHKTSNPKAARGLIFDASYNSRSPALETCPRCASDTHKRANRDATGIHCRKCGAVVKDEWVEILVGIDARKDPDFARGVRTGELATGSMGCECMSTQCNVCSHVAYTRSEFCDHIRQPNKGALWRKVRGEWVKTNVNEVTREANRRGMKFVPADFCYLTADDFEVRKGFEYCQNTIFGEYSRVGQPADPKARQQEILNVVAETASAPAHDAVPSPSSLKAETAALLQASRGGKVASKTAAKFVVIRVNGNDADVHAAESLEAAMAMADVDPSSAQIEYMDVEADSPEMAVTAFDPALAKDADVTLTAPPDEAIVIQPPTPGAPGAPGAVPGAPAPGPAPDLQDLQGPGGPQAPADEQLSPEDMGMIPPGASAHRPSAARRKPMKFAKTYAGWTVDITPSGNARVLNAEGRQVLAVRAKSAPIDAQYKFAEGVLRSLHTDGLVATAKTYSAAFTNVAQVVDNAINDMKNFQSKPLHDSVLDAAESDKAEPVEGRPSNVLEDAADSDDMDDARGKPLKSTQDGGSVDHDEGVPDGVDSVTQEDNTDMDLKRAPADVAKDKVYKNEIHDHTEKFASGTRIAHTAKTDVVWTVRQALKDGSVVISAEGRKPRKLSAEDLTHWRSAETEAEVEASAEAPKAEKEVACNVSAAAHAKAVKAARVAEAKLAKLQRKVEKLEAVSATALENERSASVTAFCRALRLVAARQDSNLEQAPLRLVAEQCIAQPRSLGTDAQGQALNYAGADQDLARYLVAEIFAKGHGRHLETLMHRAAELMSRGDQYLLDAEADVKNFQPALPKLTAASVTQLDEVSARAQLVHQAAMSGNFVVAPTPTQPAAQPVMDKRASLKAAMSGLTLNQRLASRGF